ncbi:MAG: Holliday junction branch migration protein RuvA [Lachnospiraceae bacterium]|nr:Holliday junction branch migration protein RuvA [Lachnospiraceae bacterium]
MISYIRGDVLFRNESSVVIDVNGIGYEVFVPYPVLCAMERAQGSQVELYTYLQVKEDGVALFGFADRQDLATFKYLITVNGIGPKGALGIMSYMSTKDLMLAVLAEDAKAIAKAPGIGAKTASKLIIELKDKFKLEDTFDGGISAADLGTAQAKAGAASEPDDLTEIKNEAVQALTALGYSSSEALKAVRSVPAEDGMTVEKLLKAALKYI